MAEGGSLGFITGCVRLGSVALLGRNTLKMQPILVVLCVLSVRVASGASMSFFMQTL